MIEMKHKDKGRRFAIATTRLREALREAMRGGDA